MPEREPGLLRRPAFESENRPLCMAGFCSFFPCLSAACTHQIVLPRLLICRSYPCDQLGINFLRFGQINDVITHASFWLFKQTFVFAEVFCIDAHLEARIRFRPDHCKLLFSPQADIPLLGNDLKCSEFVDVFHQRFVNKAEARLWAAVNFIENCLQGLSFRGPLAILPGRVMLAPPGRE
jgi:hypothetical protein